MEIRRYLRVLRRWWWLLLAATVIAAGSSYYVTRSQPRIYSSRARVMVGTSIQSANPDWMAINTASQLALTYVELATATPILNGVEAQLQNQGYTIPTDALRGMIAVKLVQGTQILDITVIDVDPNRAAAIANAVADEMIRKSPGGSESSEASRLNSLKEQIQELEARINSAKTEIANINAAIPGENSARAIAEMTARRDLLQQQVYQWESTRAQLEVAVSGGRANVLDVVEWAEPNYAPIGPQTTTNVALAGAIGALLATGAILLLEYLDDTVKSGEELSTLSGVPFLGIVPRMAQSEQAPERLVTLSKPRSNISECFRVLRTNLQFSSFDRPLRTVLVSSPQPTEGKSTTAANLAVVFAQAGKRVILVDTDLRRPILHRIFEAPNDWGLTSLLIADDRDVASGVCPTKVERLFFVPSGPLPPNPSEMLGSQRMQGLIEQFQQVADVIIFDSPPLLTVTDSTVLATRVDGVVLVTDSGATRREAVRKAVESLHQVGARLLGTILNRVNTRSEGYYYYYYYSHYYGEDGQRKKRRRRKLGHQHKPEEQVAR